MMDYYLITNARGKLAHVAGPHDKPLCKPDTKGSFARTLFGRKMKMCQPCADAELRALYVRTEW